MLESYIQTKILDYLKTVPNCWTVKVMTANKNGTPDILVCYHGHFIGFEVKTKTGRTSPIQDYQIAKIKGAGGSAVVVRSVEQVENFLRQLASDKSFVLH